MKKGILTIFAATLFMSLMLSSCLGDAKTKVEQSNALSYIKRNSYNTNMAVTNGYVFTNDYLKTLDVGYFYKLDFTLHIQEDGQNPDGTYIARNVSAVGDGLPVPTENYTPNLPQNPENIIYPTQINVSMFSPYAAALDDKWVFSYECRVYEDDLVVIDLATKRNNIKMVATLLTKDQETTSPGSEGDVNPLDPNKAVVRLYLERVDPARKPVDPSKAKIVPYVGMASIDLHELRSYFLGKMGSEDGTKGIIEFMYTTNSAGQNQTPNTTEKALGNLDEANPIYYMEIKE